MKNSIVHHDEAKITWDNAKILGIDIFDSYEKTAKSFAYEINIILENEKNNFNNKNLTIGVVCGLGGNAVDAILTTCELSNKTDSIITVYLIGRTTNNTSEFFNLAWEKLEKVCKKNKNVTFKQEVYAEDVEQHTVLLEALTGTGIEGVKLNKRFKDIVARISHFESKIIAIDQPTLHYLPDYVISIDYPKTKDSIVIQSHLPQELKLFCGPGEKNSLWKQKQTTHKTKNGNLLILSSEDAKYEGEYSNITLYNLNNILEDSNFENVIDQVDAVYITDITNSFGYKTILESIFENFSSKTFIVNLDSTVLVDFEKIPSSSILGVSSSKIASVFGSGGNIGVAKSLAQKHKFNFVVFGFTISLFSARGDFRSVSLTSAKTLDGLLRFAAEYATKNDGWLSLRAAIC
jgi:NAD(P)H-hydrate repair Nnr-like enzyme with NAD(P)H-hydrate epimerase domain